MENQLTACSKCKDAETGCCDCKKFKAQQQQLRLQEKKQSRKEE